MSALRSARLKVPFGSAHGQTFGAKLRTTPKTWASRKVFFGGVISLAVAVAGTVSLGLSLFDAPALALALFAMAVVGSLIATACTSQVSGRTIWIVLLGLRLLCLFAPMLFSDDLFRYVHEGRATRLGLAVPYTVPPAHIRPPPVDGLSEHVNHPEIPAAYPPFTQLVGAAVTGMGDAIGYPVAVWRIFLVLVDLAIVWMFWRRRERFPSAYAKYGLHVLPLLEVAMGAHLDILGAALLVGTLLWSESTIFAGVTIGFACGVKPIAALGALAFPMRLRRLHPLGLGIAVGVVLPAAPYLIEGVPLHRGLVEYGTRWRAQPLAFAAIDSAMSSFFDARVAEKRYAHLHLMEHSPYACIEDAGVTRWTLTDKTASSSCAERGSARPLLLDAGWFARLFSLALSMLALGLLLWRRSANAGRLAAAFTVFVLFTPTLHPWYLLWLLPFAILSNADLLILAAALSPLSYDVVFRYRATGSWDESAWPRVGIMLVLCGYALWRTWMHRNQRRAATAGQKAASTRDDVPQIKSSTAES